MSEANPYKSSDILEKQAPLASGFFPLATRWQRFVGNFVDSILMILVAIVPYTGLLIAYGMFVDPSYLESDSIGPRHMQDFVVETVLVLICISGAFLALNGYLLTKRGQTIGKLLVKTRMVGDDDQLVPLGRVFLMRYLWLWIISMVPFGGLFALINAAAIFGDDRKCVHDKVASTKVISIR